MTTTLRRFIAALSIGARKTVRKMRHAWVDSKTPTRGHKKSRNNTRFLRFPEAFALDSLHLFLGAPCVRNTARSIGRRMARAKAPRLGWRKHRSHAGSRHEILESCGPRADPDSSPHEPSSPSSSSLTSLLSARLLRISGPTLSSSLPMTSVTATWAATKRQR
jgi:hypothetical protein